MYCYVIFGENNEKKPKYYLYEYNGTVESGEVVVVPTKETLKIALVRYIFKEIPDDIEIVSIGNGLTHVDAFLNPSLSIIEIPLEKMAGECLHVLNQLFSQSLIINKSVEPQTIVRESLK